jgi:hypothetical protein
MAAACEIMAPRHVAKPSNQHRNDGSRLLLSGGLLVAVGCLLLGVEYALTGDVSPAGASLLAWVTVCGGALRAAGGVLRWRLRSRPEAAEQPLLVATDLPTILEPVALEPMAIEEAAPEAAAAAPTPAAVRRPATPLAYDLALLGLGPDPVFSQVRRAYWAMRERWELSFAPDAPERITDLYNAYRRLRRMYIDSGAI